MSDSLLSIYRRAEDYFLVVSAKTTAGLWQDVGEPPAVLDTSASPARIGGEAVQRLAEPRPTSPHPGQNEWQQARRKSLDPIIRAAKVRSWHEFITGTSLVQVERTDDSFNVTAMKALPKPHGSFEPVTEEDLASPSAEQLGQAIIGAFKAATPA